MDRGARTVRLLGALVAAVLAAHGGAWAQPDQRQDRDPPGTGPAGEEPDGDSATPSSQPKPGGETAEPDPRDDPAWALYHQAYSAVASGDRARARDLIAQLLTDHRDHPAALLARAIGRRLTQARPAGSTSGDGKTGGPGSSIDRTAGPPHSIDRTAGPPHSIDRTAGPPHSIDRTAGEGGQGEGKTADRPEDTSAGLLGPEEHSTAARAELALLQMIHGIGVGVELCILLDCDDGNAAVTLALLGGTLGVTTSLLTTRNHFTQGSRALLNSGTLWGAYNGALIAAILDPREDAGRKIAGLLLTGQLGGLIAGGALTRYGLTEGQVALANTFGVWSGFFTVMSLILADVDIDETAALLPLLLASDAGLLAGAYLSTQYATSRGYTLLVDAGGILGGLTGYATAVLLDEQPSDQLVAGTIILGAGLGIAAAAFLAPSWDFAEAPMRLSLVPVLGGGVSAGVSFDVDL